jgi:hypothetical protein
VSGPGRSVPLTPEAQADIDREEADRLLAAPAPGLPPVERLEAVRLEKGDVLVATIPAGCDRQEADEVRCQLAAVFGQDANILVIDGDVTLNGYRPIRERT